MISIIASNIRRINVARCFKISYNYKIKKTKDGLYETRQDMVPKNHNSGVYWVRANSNSGNQRMEEDRGGFTGLFVIIFAILFIICALVD